MASFKSSQGVSVLLVALLVCQAFVVPSLARTQVVIGANKLAEPKPDTVTPQGHGGGGYGHGDNSDHRPEEGNAGHGGYGGSDRYGGHEYRGHGHQGGGPDGAAGHKGGHG